MKPLYARLEVLHVLQSYVPHENAAVTSWLPCHAIDLSKDGRLDAHVDSVKFSGGIVAGISLLSDSIMRLRPAKRTLTMEHMRTRCMMT